MSEFIVPGNAADQLTRSTNVAGFAPPSSTADYEDPYGIGEQSVVEGAYCDHQPAGARNCFLPPELRGRLIDGFRENVDAASSSYRFALLDIKTELKLAKDDDLPLMLSIAIDVAGAFISSSLARVLRTAVTPALNEVRNMAGARALVTAVAGRAPDSTWETIAKSQLARVTPEQLEGMTKAGFTSVTVATKKRIAHEASDVPPPGASDRVHQVSYLDQLGDSCELSFNRFKLDASANANDAQLVVLFHGMKRENHLQGMYKAALLAKLDRFKRSGVKHLGEAHEGGARMDEWKRQRVVWVQDGSGHRTLWYETEHFKRDVGLDYGRYPPATKWVEWNHRKELERPVPDEFVEPALIRSEQIFGPTQTIKRAAPIDAFMEAFGHYADGPMHSRQASQPPAPTSAAGATAPGYDPLAPFAPWR